MMDHREYTFQDIAEAFEYEPEEGLLWRKEPDGSLREVSLVHECNKERFRTAAPEFRGERIQATHIIWMLMKRRWPEPGMVMDHKDRNRRNCRWSNLRELTVGQSNMNRRRWGNSEEGLERGVRRQGNRYAVQISIHGTTKRFASYINKHDANALARSIRESLYSEWRPEANEPPNHDYAMSGG